MRFSLKRLRVAHIAINHLVGAKKDWWQLEKRHEGNLTKLISFGLLGCCATVRNASGFAINTSCDTYDSYQGYPLVYLRDKVIADRPALRWVGVGVLFGIAISCSLLSIAIVVSSLLFTLVLRSTAAATVMLSATATATFLCLASSITVLTWYIAVSDETHLPRPRIYHQQILCFASAALYVL